MMIEDEQDPLLEPCEKPDDTEIEIARKMVGFNSFKLSDKPNWDLRRKVILSRILPLLFSGKTYDEIHDELNIARSQVYEILKIYYQAVDQNELVDMYWWQLFFTLVKNKPEVAFNALTQIKLKRIGLNQITQTEEIIITWMKVKNEQNSPSGNSVSPALGSETCPRLPEQIPDGSQRKALGQNDVGRE